MSICDQFLLSVKPTSFVNGVNVPLYIKQEDVNETVRNFQLEPSDVWISTFPKAGTTWTQQIVKFIRNEGESDDIKINESIPWLEANGQFNIDLTSLNKPRAFKSHMPYNAMPYGRPHETPYTAISLYYHYLRLQVQEDAVLDWDIFFHAFSGGRLIYGDFFDHVLSWWSHRNDDNVLFLTYEQMKRDLLTAITRIAHFIDADISDEIIAKIATKTTFDAMKNDNTANYSWSFLPSNKGMAPHMRKGEVGDWKNHFTPEQSAEIDELCQERLKDTGLVFDFGE